MSLKPQSIRKNVRVIWNGEPISKQEIIDMSVYWSEVQINFFKKMLKQGGTVKINKNKFKIIIIDNSNDRELEKNIKLN